MSALRVSRRIELDPAPPGPAQGPTPPPFYRDKTQHVQRVQDVAEGPYSILLAFLAWTALAESDPAAPSNLNGEIVNCGVALSRNSPTEDVESVDG